MAAALLYSGALLVGMLLMLEVGRWLGGRGLARDPEGSRAGIASVEAFVFGLMGLLMAFTFSGAASRFDARRKLIVDETNAIGTAYLRVDLLPEDAQPALRNAFRSYLDSRLATYRRLPDLAGARAELARSAGLQRTIWRQAERGCGRAALSSGACMLLLPALNQMIDITTTRTLAAQTHPPMVIFGLLFGLGIVCAVLAGYATAASRSRSWLHLLGFTLVAATTVYVILDLEYPRLGLIRVEAFDRALVELRASMN